MTITIALSEINSICTKNCGAGSLKRAFGGSNVFRVFDSTGLLFEFHLFGLEEKAQLRLPQLKRMSREMYYTPESAACLRSRIADRIDAARLRRVAIAEYEKRQDAQVRARVVFEEKAGALVLGGLKNDLRTVYLVSFGFDEVAGTSARYGYQAPEKGFKPPFLAEFNVTTPEALAEWCKSLDQVIIGKQAQALIK